MKYEFDPLDDPFEATSTGAAGIGIVEVDEEGEKVEVAQADPDESIFNSSPLSPSTSLQVEFVTGPAGSGKTHLIRSRMAAAPEGSIQLAATTGIAAVNLGEGVTTIHSLLKYFNTASLQDSFFSGQAQRALARLIREQGMRELVVDEVSMLDAAQLDLIVTIMRDTAINLKVPLKLTLTGDFCQLPPVVEQGKGKDGVPFAFKASCWPEFAASTTKLEKIWRQSSPLFLEALNAARRGDGAGAVEALKRWGVQFHPSLDPQFSGSTIMGTNAAVDRFNLLRLRELKGRRVELPSMRWGLDEVWKNGDAARMPAVWKNIPSSLELAEGTLVMILANDTQEWRYVNGDLGILEGLTAAPEADEGRKTERLHILLNVRLQRTGQLVQVGALTREITQKTKPETTQPIWRQHTTDRAPLMKTWKESQTEWGVPYRNLSGRWVLGGVTYYPVRVAYATTCHKSQGLSLDSVQLDLREWFMGSPAMMYVGMSRCRTPEGLRLVGTEEMMAQKCKVHPEVVEWL